MPKGVVDIDRGWKAFRALMGDANGKVVVVGITEGQVATYAAANEFGVPDETGKAHYSPWRIPPRPFMRTTIDDNADEIGRRLRKAIANAIAKREQDADAELLKVGLYVRNEMIKTIIRWEEPENAPATVRAKHGTNNPLVDTGAAGMQGAITYEIRKK